MNKVEFPQFQNVKIPNNYACDIDEINKNEFARLFECVYVDHAAATLYSEKQINDFCSHLKSSLYSNPHSKNTSSELTSEAIDFIRNRILTFFNTNKDEYEVIFTSGATDAVKIISESFPWHSKSCYVYTQENHTSILGVREAANKRRALIYSVPSDLLAERLCDSSNASKDKNDEDSFIGLLAYSAQCNFSGKKYPLEWIERIVQGSFCPPQKYCINGKGSLNCEFEKKKYCWYVLLDASCFAATSFLDLSKHKPDFVPISFYKLFGFPTGLGCLLVSKRGGSVLRREYFGGGTVVLADSVKMTYKPRLALHQRFEDGTLPFLDILAIEIGFKTIERITGGIRNVETHVANIARYFAYNLRSMRHSNDLPVADIYGAEEIIHSGSHGSIINFNLKDNCGQYIGYSTVEKVASVYNIHLRTGCMCNPGACQKYLNISSNQLLNHFEAGHECGDAKDLVNGLPTGSVRVSFGYISTYQDAEAVLRMVSESFVTGDLKFDASWLENEPPKVAVGGNNLNERKIEDRSIELLSSDSTTCVHPHENSSREFVVRGSTGLFGEEKISLNKFNIRNNESFIDFLPNHDTSLRSNCNEFTLLSGETKVASDHSENIPQNGNVVSEEDTRNVEEFSKENSYSESLLSSDNSSSQKNESPFFVLPPIQRFALSFHRRQRSLESQCLTLKEILIYPVKSCAGVSVPKWPLSAYGLRHDRRWMIVTSTGVTLTQKRCPKMCLMFPAVEKEFLILTYRGNLSPAIPLTSDPLDNATMDQSTAEICCGRVCGDRVRGSCSGAEIGKWLSDVLEMEGLRLIQQMTARKSKRTLDGNSSTLNLQLSLSNECQFLVLFQPSINFIQRKIRENSGLTITQENLIKRFRPNFIVEGVGSPFEEDDWESLDIGGARLGIVGGCSRCQMVCVDPLTGLKTPEPLLTLRETRGSSMNFGSYATSSSGQGSQDHEETGPMKVDGDTAICFNVGMKVRRRFKDGNLA